MATLYLVLPAGTLTAGGYYQFQLSAVYAPGTGAASVTPGYSVLTVQMNAPPSSGKLAVTVNGGDPVGTVLQDPYDFQCTGWVDDVSDLPLLYSFYYAIYGSATEYQLISNTPADNYDGALLPRGGGNASEITCIAYIADSYAAASRATAVATVLPMVVAVSDLANLTAKLLAESFEAGNVEGVFQSMVASSSVLNAPNCTVPCTGSINRATCEVAEMCGDCADGFVGVLGPSNEPCYVAAENCSNGVRDGNETETDCGGPCAPCAAAGAGCTLDTDCLYSWCTVLGVCAVPVKTCPGSNCTFGQGVCSHVDVTGATLASRDCLANDWACSAVCTCRERFDANGSAAGMWYGDRSEEHTSELQSP